MIGMSWFNGILPPTFSLDNLNNLNTTNYRTVETTRVFKVVIYVALLMFMHETIANHDDSASNILDSMLLALFGFAGVNTAQYAAKRFSNTQMVAAKEAAKATASPAQVVNTTGSVIAQSPGGPVDASPSATAEMPTEGTVVRGESLEQAKTETEQVEVNGWRDNRTTIL